MLCFQVFSMLKLLGNTKFRFYRKTKVTLNRIYVLFAFEYCPWGYWLQCEWTSTSLSSVNCYKNSRDTEAGQREWRRRMKESEDCTYNTSGKKRKWKQKEMDYKVKGEIIIIQVVVRWKQQLQQQQQKSKEFELMSSQMQRNTNLWWQ